MKNKKINIFKEFDYFLFIPVLLLTGIGVLVMRSATRTMETGDADFRKHLISIAIGLVCCLAICLIDYKKLKVIGFVGFIITTGLLVYVLFGGSGMVEWGSRSWLTLPIIGNFQPSELAKITMIIVVAVFFESAQVEKRQKKLNYIIAFGVATLTMGLIILERDFGMTIVFFAIFFGMIFSSNIKARYILITIGSAAAVAAVSWMFLLNDARKSRILVLLDPEKYADSSSSAAYHLENSIRTIGSGELTGKGYMEGITNVPTKTTDFVFAVFGEEFGFVGVILLLVIIFVFLCRGLYIAYKARDLFGTYVAVGLISMLAFVFIQNIGMCVGVFPITGLPLPFISFGGTAMVTNYVAVGILLSISMRKKRILMFVED